MACPASSSGVGADQRNGAMSFLHRARVQQTLLILFTGMALMY